MKKIIICLTIIFIYALLTIGVLLTYNKQSFKGTLNKNDSTYILDATYINGKNTHTLKLTEDSHIKVEFKTTKGTMKLTIIDPNKNVIFEGNGIDVNTFTIQIKESGNYDIIIKASHASGKIKITNI